jgi:Glycosyltransferase Family 4/beta-1,4-mannooligosaccharide phosphorylase
MGARNSPTGRIALIGNYLPRQCGIATFTTHLCEAIVAQQGSDACFAIPVNDHPTGYAYPDRVRFELSERDLTSYQRAADFLNMSSVDVVCLQHEYGIFGGQSGSHILALLRELRMPIVTTLHTVLENPDAGQRQVLEELASLSDRLVVMSERAIEFLTGVYEVPRAKIELIPHGIPDVPFVDPNFYKDQFGVQGKTVLLVECIGAADLYLTPYLNPAQIVSGTLAYTLGAGKVVISTPYSGPEVLPTRDRARRRRLCCAVRRECRPSGARQAPGARARPAAPNQLCGAVRAVCHRGDGRRCVSTWRRTPGEGESCARAGGCRRLDPAARRPVGTNSYVPNVVFSCGAIAEPDGSVKLYWGGADSVMCVGSARIDELVDRCLNSRRPSTIEPVR